MIDYAHVVDDDGTTACYVYQPWPAAPAVRRGPMPSGMARRRVMFLNGIEEPTTGGLPEDYRKLRAFEDDF